MTVNDIVIRLASTLYPAADAMDQALYGLPEGFARDQATAAMVRFQDAYHALIEDLIAEIYAHRTVRGAPEQPSDAETTAILAALGAEAGATVQ